MIKYALICCMSLGTLSVSAQLVDEKHQLLWEISGNGLTEKSYLYGSFHTNDRRVFNLADSVYVAMSNTDAVATEVDIFSLFNDEEWDTRYGRVRLKYDRNGEPFTASNNSTNTAYGSEDGMPQFLDAYFQQYCLNAEKPFIALETLEEQEAVVDDFEFSFSGRSRLGSILMSEEDFIDMYLRGDIYQIDETMKSTYGGANGYYKKLITDRNIVMANRMDSIIKSGTSLYTAVGAGHLAGTFGIINLMRSKGYTVRKVLATYSDDLTIDKLKVKSMRTYLYSNDSIGVTIEFPGKPVTVLNEDGYEDYQLKLIYRDLGQGNTYSVEFYERNDESTLEELAQIYIASPSESPYRKVTLENGGEAYEGVSDAYPEGLYWTRVVLGEDHILVLKAYGGNKFMNSKRAFTFFDKVWLD